MKVWDEELLVENKEEQEQTHKDKIPKAFPYSLISNAAAACFYLGLAFCSTINQNQN